MVEVTVQLLRAPAPLPPDLELPAGISPFSLRLLPWGYFIAATVTGGGGQVFPYSWSLTEGTEIKVHADLQKQQGTLFKAKQMKDQTTLQGNARTHEWRYSRYRYCLRPFFIEVKRKDTLGWFPVLMIDRSGHTIAFLLHVPLIKHLTFNICMPKYAQALGGKQEFSQKVIALFFF